MKIICSRLDALRPYAPVLIRVIIGYLLIRHGWDKFDAGLGNVEEVFRGWGVPAPAITARITAVVELVGGIALVLGLATRMVAALMSMILVGAIVWVKADIGVLNGAETDLAYIAALVSLIVTGPGRPNLDELVGIEPRSSANSVATRSLVDA